MIKKCDIKNIKGVKSLSKKRKKEREEMQMLTATGVTIRFGKELYLKM